MIISKQAKIYVAGHDGLVGSSIMRKLKSQGFSNIIFEPFKNLDLTNQTTTKKFLEKEKPEYIIDAAAKVGGIMANSLHQADFLYQNIMIQMNLMQSAYEIGVKKFVFLGSSCIYPKASKQPIKEDYFWTGPLEPTNFGYAAAKSVGIKMCEAYNDQYKTDFISLMPTNIFGPHDNFNIETSHVLPAMIHRFHIAKVRSDNSVTVWGTGTPMREFLFVDDLADATVFLMKNYTGSKHVNVGTGKDITIKELAETIKEIVGFKGEIIWDTSKPDGMMRKLLDVSKLKSLGWEYKTELKEGIKKSYDWFLENIKPAI